jgi:hypothetical protein
MQHRPGSDVFDPRYRTSIPGLDPPRSAPGRQTKRQISDSDMAAATNEREAQPQPQRSAPLPITEHRTDRPHGSRGSRRSQPNQAHNRGYHRHREQARDPVSCAHRRSLASGCTSRTDRRDRSPRLAASLLLRSKHDSRSTSRRCQQLRRERGYTGLRCWAETTARSKLTAALDSAAHGNRACLRPHASRFPSYQSGQSGTLRRSILAARSSPDEASRLGCRFRPPPERSRSRDARHKMPEM